MPTTLNTSPKRNNRLLGSGTLPLSLAPRTLKASDGMEPRQPAKSRCFHLARNSN
jgi:hypothetical protein